MRNSLSNALVIHRNQFNCYFDHWDTTIIRRGSNLLRPKIECCYQILSKYKSEPQILSNISVPEIITPFKSQLMSNPTQSQFLQQFITIWHWISGKLPRGLIFHLCVSCPGEFSFIKMIEMCCSLYKIIWIILFYGHTHFKQII